MKPGNNLPDDLGLTAGFGVECEETPCRIASGLETTIMKKMHASYRSLLGLDQGAKKFHVHVTELDPAGEGWEQQHAHAAEEALFMLEGQAEFTFGGKRHAIGPGELVLFPANVMHAQTRFLTRKVKYLVIRSFEPGDDRCCCGATLSST